MINFAAVGAALAVVAAIGAGGYAKGWSDRGDRDRSAQLREQIADLRDKHKKAVELNMRIANAANEARIAAAQRKEQVDDLQKQLDAKPVPDACAWTPAERRRVLGIPTSKPRRPANP